MLLPYRYLYSLILHLFTCSLHVVENFYFIVLWSPPCVKCILCWKIFISFLFYYFLGEIASIYKLFPMIEKNPIKQGTLTCNPYYFLYQSVIFSLVYIIYKENNTSFSQVVMGNFYFGHFLQILLQVYIPKHLVGEVDLRPEKKSTCGQI